MGGPPSKGTSKDMRLSRNNPDAGKKGKVPAGSGSAMSSQKPIKKGGNK